MTTCQVRWTGGLQGCHEKGLRLSSATVVGAANKDTLTCTLDERLGDVAARAKAANTDACIVVSPDHIVLGRLRSKALAGNPSALVEDVMESGPTTIRPNTLLNETIELLRSKSVGSIPGH